MAHLAKICIFFTCFSIYTSSACALSDIFLQEYLHVFAILFLYNRFCNFILKSFTCLSIYINEQPCSLLCELYTGKLRVELFLATVTTFKTPVRTKYTIFFLAPSEICFTVEISVIFIE